MRIAGIKILHDEHCNYGVVSDEEKPYYYVENSDQTVRLKLYHSDLRGYAYKDKLSNMIEPSDPRHMVNTQGFQLHLEGILENPDLHWVKKEDIMNPQKQNGGFAFNHHRNIVAHLSARNSLEAERSASHHAFMRNIVDSPIEAYTDLKERFKNNNNSPETSFPELLPVIDQIMEKMYSPEVNEICENNPFAL